MEQTEQFKVLVEQNRQIIEMLGRIEKTQSLVIERESYTTDQAAERLARAEWTVRQWCNTGQVKANKVRGKGRTGEWRITHEELVRLQNEGPMPRGSFDNHGGKITAPHRRAS